MALIASRYCRATKRATSTSGLVGHEEIGGASGRGETRQQVGQTREGKHDERKKPGEGGGGDLPEGNALEPFFSTWPQPRPLKHSGLSRSRDTTQQSSHGGKDVLKPDPRGQPVDLMGIIRLNVTHSAACAVPVGLYHN